MLQSGNDLIDGRSLGDKVRTDPVRQIHSLLHQRGFTVIYKHAREDQIARYFFTKFRTNHLGC